MKKWQNDGTSEAAAAISTGTGVAIDIDSDDGDDNESTTAEHELLLPAPTPLSLPVSAVTSAQQQQQQQTISSGSTNINMEPLNQTTRFNNNSNHNNSLLANFLYRQRSFTPVSSSGGSSAAHLNRRLQQSRSVSSAQEEQQQATAVATPAATAAVRQLGIWRVNLNEMFTLSTAPSTEALRSFITHSNFRYQPTGGAATNADLEAAAAAGSGSNSGSSALRLSNQMGRSVSLREEELQPGRNALNARHTASVLGLSTQLAATPTTAATTTAALPATYDATAAGAAAAAAAAPIAAAAVPEAEPTADEEHLITDMVVQLLSHFVRYLPIICILLIKFVHDHLLALLDLLLLLSVMYNVNRSLRLQVARLTQKNYAVLLRDGCLLLLVITVRLFMANTRPDPWGLLVPPPKVYQLLEVSSSSSPAASSSQSDQLSSTFLSGVDSANPKTTESTVPKVIPLGLLLYYVAVSDLLLRLLTILVKIGITMLPLRLMRLKVRARLYVLVEYISQFYRALAPISQWFLFLYESYTGLEVISGGLLSSLYIGAKIFELVERGKSLKKAITTFRRNIDAERAPTKDELDAAGAVCPICHDAFTSPIVLECGHIFCDECVQTWFKREQTCPMCRAKVSDDPAWQDGSTTFFHQLY